MEALLEREAKNSALANNPSEIKAIETLHGSDSNVDHVKREASSVATTGADIVPAVRSRSVERMRDDVLQRWYRQCTAQDPSGLSFALQTSQI